MARKKPGSAKNDRPIKTLKLELCSSNIKLRRRAARALLKLTEDEERDAALKTLDPGKGWPPETPILAALAKAQPMLPEVAKAMSEKLGSCFWVASEALAGLVNLPPKQRDKWVPAMLDHLKRFEKNSEWSWIIECLPPHYRRHRTRSERALKAGLKSSYAFGPRSVMERPAPGRPDSRCSGPRRACLHSSPAGLYRRGASPDPY
jgi:hypothetical protein